MSPSLDAILFETEQPVAFERAWQTQRQLQQRLLRDPTGPDALMLLEHEPCYTMGRGSDPGFLRFDPADPPWPLHRIDRGGEVTHHLPGQLVLYPVLNLERHGADLHSYLRGLEQVVIDLVAALGLGANRIEGLTGVWIEGKKVAAIGVGAKRWISQHGLALNVSCALEGFTHVIPCGIVDRPVGRLIDWLPELSCGQLRPLLIDTFSRQFDLALRPPAPHEVLQGW